MARSSLRAWVSLGTISIGMVFALGAIPFMGCGRFYEDFTGGQGTCDDDGNPCTIDKCAAGATTHEPAPNGIDCSLGENAGVCQSGLCKLNCESNPASCKCEAGTNKDCPEGDLCAEWTCADSGQCVKTPIVDKEGMAVGDQSLKDCKTNRCVGGTLTEVPDDTDQPDDEPCVDRSCSPAGEIVEMPKAWGLDCDANGECNGAGQCLEAVCLTRADREKCGADCKLPLCTGETCAMSDPCESGHCVDGYCCNETCTGECKSCGIPGSLGQCTNVPFYEEDPGTCLKTNYVLCDGAGQCLSFVNRPCVLGTDCISGECLDKSGSNDVCKGTTGEPCVGDATICRSGVCTDGVCKGGAGERCDVSADCASPLMCSAGKCSM